MDKTLTRAQKVEEKKHRIYILGSTLRDYILIHAEDNSSLKEVNDTIQMHILYLFLSTLFPVNIFYHLTLCPVGRLLHLTLFPVDLFYHSKLRPVQPLLYSTLFPVDIFLLFDVLSHSVFITFVLMSFWHYFPFDVVSFRHFLLFNVFTIDLLSHLTFCPPTFFTVGVFYFDILSVNFNFSLAFNASSIYCYDFFPAFKASLALLFKSHCLILHRHLFFRQNHCLMLHRHYFSMTLPTSGNGLKVASFV
jgi:hypothetical protein